MSYFTNRLEVLQRDRFTCQICGSKHSLEVHHKNKLRNGNAYADLDDLITLCKSCHRMVELKLPRPMISDKPIGSSIPTEFYRKLNRIAKKLNLTRSGVIRLCVIHTLECKSVNWDEKT